MPPARPFEVFRQGLFENAGINPLVYDAFNAFSEPSANDDPRSMRHVPGALGRLAVAVEAVQERHEISCEEESRDHAPHNDDRQRLLVLHSDFHGNGSG